MFECNLKYSSYGNVLLYLLEDQYLRITENRYYHIWKYIYIYILKSFFKKVNVTNKSYASQNISGAKNLLSYLSLHTFRKHELL